MKNVRLTAWLALSLVVLFAGRSPKYEIGDAVVDFKLKNVDGKYISLSDYKTSKGVIVIFDCNTCPYSKAYNDRIQTLSKTYAPKGFPLVAINANDPEVSPGDSFNEMVAVAKKKKYDFPYLVDETQQVAKAFGASNTPHVFVLQKEGSDFKVAYIGAIDNNTRDEKAADKKYVEEAVDALLAGRPVPTSKTKAIGCGIKWKNV
ncbi:MAG TPA: thioredoxin family protein [Ohtaekwangia sp.]|uniref:thioredoxin family protein n=1 Tax=Ohtaekwangia sp. TaxID=2066019 RepID=UPI002F95559A